MLQIYQAGERLPPSEHFGLLQQLRRSATSIATRIADGAGRDANSDYAIELKRARANGHELEYLLLLSYDLGYLPEEIYQKLSGETVEICKMISGLLQRLATSP